MDKDRFIKFSALLNSAEKSISRMKHLKMAEYGLDNAHTLCLCVLSEYKEGLTKTELAALCRVDKAQISRVINVLQKKNFVETEESQRAYKQKYSLTASGQKVSSEINSLILEINSYVSDSIPSDYINIFYTTFSTICDNLKRAEDLFISNCKQENENE